MNAQYLDMTLQLSQPVYISACQMAMFLHAHFTLYLIAQKAPKAFPEAERALSHLWPHSSDTIWLLWGWGQHRWCYLTFWNKTTWLGSGNDLWYLVSDFWVKVPCVNFNKILLSCIATNNFPSGQEAFIQRTTIVQEPAWTAKVSYDHIFGLPLAKHPLSGPPPGKPRRFFGTE